MQICSPFMNDLPTTVSDLILSLPSIVTYYCVVVLLLV